MSAKGFPTFFHVTNDEAIAPVQYNYRDKAALIEKGTPYYVSGEWQGVSVFLREGDDVFHTYSAYERAIEGLVNSYNFLDLTPLGRQVHITEIGFHDSYAS